MAQFSSIVSYLDKLLTPSLYSEPAWNGVQVDSAMGDVRKVAFAVDAGLSVIEKAINEECNLLIVHHGLLWGKALPINGSFGEKIRALIKGRCSLYASHLPLDGNSEVGNGFELARYFGLGNIEGFCLHYGGFVGAKATSAKPLPLEFFLEKGAAMVGAIKPLVLPFGAREIRKVGLVTGSGSSAITLAHEEGLDLLISGESKQEAYHLAKELKINVIFFGHYATETFGVRALAPRVKAGFDVETIFIDEPTGI